MQSNMLHGKAKCTNSYATHGQPASPTTLGKGMAKFSARLSDQGKTFSEVRILGKFAGAVGNYNAHKVACPDINWPNVAAEFVRSLGLEFNPYVTQVNESRLAEDLEETWEVLAEPIQTVMRRYAIPEPYEMLKELTRGRADTKDSIRQFVEGLDLPEEPRSILLKPTPHSYIGESEKLARAVEDYVDLTSGFKIQ